MNTHHPPRYRAVFQYHGRGRIHYRSVDFDPIAHRADPQAYLITLQHRLGPGVTLIRVESVEAEAVSQRIPPCAA